MPRADHVALLKRRGQEHNFIRVVPGTANAATNTVTAPTETSITGYGVFQESKETAVNGVAVLEGDELLLFDATPLQTARVIPKSGDAIESTDGTRRRPIVARKPKRGFDGEVWFYQLLLRGAIEG